MKLFYAIILLLIIFTGCERNPQQIQQVEREDHFTLDIGRLEDQIALFMVDNHGIMQQTRMAMRDGFFYISDGNGAKVQRFNSYGDLLFMIYNEELNPPPLSLRPLQEGSLVTRWAISYPLQEPGYIAVDSRNHIYVQDRMPYERHSFDPETRAYLDNVVLHFDADGRFLQFLGSDGIGGSPFPRIEALFTSLYDDLAVVCRIPLGWNIYWFNNEGAFLYEIQLRNENIPVPPDRDMVFASLDNIAAAPDGRKLYVKINYFRDTFDESTNTRTGNEPDSSVIWIMDVESGAWERTIEVPFFEFSIDERSTSETFRVFYSMIGVSNNSRIFLSFPVAEGYSLLILSYDTDIHQQQRLIWVHPEELYYNEFNLSSDGILSALLVDEWQARLVWWRTDRISGN